ncbi:hypothetical protein LGL08_20300 [Clostridium estertheticum]|uniref:hypothetical protein n=1 Tax=Clostridium estertheticum TaxID=238834 RepID=UPI001CF2DF95|nr:hypothetical protein [Clostridium estertheticum]MCB2309048.1 hypothetical protein [Clostridium estertheticum]MCB2346818.1 hypothetical protein [Clostridium estertheticum]MCB2351870.1 hypothetical protein [Clostridium estertheticum]WAG48398.1 hypothetical protein LL127_23105 [Clostridium estertheticum]
MENTLNYNLKKPSLAENILVSDLNENADLIDAQMKQNADDLASYSADNLTQFNVVNSSISSIGTKVIDYNSYASIADVNNIYTVIDYKRADGTLYMKSTLSGGTSPSYTTDIWKFYDSTGATVILTKTWTITYDANGKITSKVVA